MPSSARPPGDLIGKANQTKGLAQVYTFFDTATPRIFADIDRAKAEHARRAAGARVRGAAGLSRLGLRQRLQPARPHLSRHRPGRRAVPRTTADIANLKTRSNSGADGADRLGRDLPGQDRAVSRDALQSLPGGRGRRRHRARLLLGPVAGDDGEARRRDPARAAMRTEWTDIAFQQKAAGNTAGIVFALAVVFVFLVLAAQYRKPDAAAGDHPDRADVPARGDGRREPAGHGQQYPDPDRPGRADRARREERDPDRRVRQAGRGAGRAVAGRGGGARGADPAAADPDDQLRLHPRRGAAGDRERGRARSCARRSAPRCSSG